MMLLLMIWSFTKRPSFIIHASCVDKVDIGRRYLSALMHAWHLSSSISLCTRQSNSLWLIRPIGGIGNYTLLMPPLL